MIVGMELGKEYAQLCVKTDRMPEPESLTTVLGEECYRIPVGSGLTEKQDLQELFRKLFKMLLPYGERSQMEYLVICLDEPTKLLREQILEITQIYNIEKGKVRFTDKKECFCTYVFHQPAELFSHHALLIENEHGKKTPQLLYRHFVNRPVTAEVSAPSQKALEDIFQEHAISSVFLVGDDFEEDWMEQNLKLLKKGKRVFQGKNLYVKGAAYQGMELKEQSRAYLYLGEEQLRYHLAVRQQNEKEPYLLLAEGAKHWYEADRHMEVLLLDQPSLEFAMIPLDGKNMKTMEILLDGLPDRPKKTTKLRISVCFENAKKVKISIEDLGFGEIFPKSGMVYKGEMQWEQ